MLLRSSLFALVLILVSALPSEAQVNAGRFQSIMGQATTRVNKTVPIDLQYEGTLKGIAGREQIQVDGAYIAWRLTLTGWAQKRGSDKIIIGQSPAVVAAYGNRFEYLFLGPDIPASVFDKVVEDTKDAQEDIVKEYKDINVSIGRQDNRIQVSAVYEYANGDGSERIENRLVHLMNSSRWVINGVLEEIQKAERDLRKEIDKGKPTFISEAEMGFYFGWDVDTYRQIQDKAPEGGWRYTSYDIGTRMWNYGDHFEMAVLIPTNSWSSDEALAAISEKALAWAQDNMPDGFQSVTVEKDYYDWTDLVLLFRHDLDGETSGKDIKKYIENFEDKFLKKAWKFTEELPDEHWEHPADTPARFYSHEVFEYLMDDGLEDLWGEHGFASEGWYEFNYQDLDYELYLLGDSTVYTIYVAMPEADDAQRDAWTASVQEWISANPSDGATAMSALRYPEYEHLLWIQATYALDGSYSGAEFKRRYHAFVEEYAVQVAAKAREIMGVGSP